MYDYITGEVTHIYSNSIALDNNGIGFLIYTPNPYKFQENKKYKVYLHQLITETENSLFGFETQEERELFLKLINVKGLGCRMALPIIATGSIDGIIDAIERENILYLKKFPKIGDKLARQMILDLKGKLGSVSSDVVVDDESLDELKEVLKGLGYKEKDIKGIVKKVDVSKSIEEQIKDALKLLLK